VLFLGLLAALAAAGFHVGQLTLVFGALGVGIGIGLQDVVRNFVSGLILMFERLIQRGDTVEVAGMVGRVGEIGLRATTVTTFDGADVVAPNGMLLADKLVNWTFSGTRRRITLDFNIVYTADPRRAIDLLVRVARGVDGVSAVPPPAAIVTGLANGVLEISLRAWTTDHVEWIQVRSELAMRIRDALADAGIEVPLPQRDLLVRMAPGNVTLASGPTSSGGHPATQEAAGADSQLAPAGGQQDSTDRKVDLGKGRTAEPGPADPTER
jgi:small-conductance mechanosensitive channel